MRISPGHAAPLGATSGEDGINFALFSAHAEKVELCLFDGEGLRETTRFNLWRTGEVWHGHVEGARAGARYGYRVHGPYEPWNGHRFNPNKLLIDPYARVLDRSFALAPAHFGYRPNDPASDLSFDDKDSAPVTPKSIVTGPWRRGGGPIFVPWRDTVLYELHVRGLTILRADLPIPLRGTLAGLASPPVIAHFKALGITSVEVLPIHPIADEPRLVRQGLRNYWGYNPINFFAIEPRYASGETIAEFARTIDVLHEAGIEIILDVVFNHTGEGDELGPTFSFRGIDNASYYMPAEDRRFYANYTGCGNTLNVGHPYVRAMVLDSLRHWARAGVDGFRFDLASTLGRDDGPFRADGALLTAIAMDAELSQVKLIAEPWDAMPDGYRLGEFPETFREWNDRFRNAARRFWRGDSGMMPELARRIAGSSDIFPSRGPLAGINFVTSHDGFTLHDVVSYAEKHNQANGENNADGANDNYSWNLGVEGPTRDAFVRDTRLRQKRNLIATLLLSLGVPMLTAGDELGRSQRGNNNAYCQDNEISWVNWSLGADDEAFLAFVRRVLGLRASHEALRRDTFFRGREDGPRPLKDIVWLKTSGGEMTMADWENAALKAFGCAFGGSRRYVLLFNASADFVHFALPTSEGGPWQRLLDTSEADGGMEIEIPAGAGWVLPASTLVLFGESPRS